MLLIVSAGALLLAGCGSGSASRSGVVPTTNGAGVTTAPAVTAPSVTATASNTPSPNTTVTSSATTASGPKPTTGSTQTPLPTLALYTEVSRPALPADHTAVLDPRWKVAGSTVLSGSIADGTYWATALSAQDGGSETITFRLTDAYFGDACLAHFTGQHDACANGYETDDRDAGDYVMIVGEAGVTVSDEATQHSLQIDGHELYRLINGQQPDAAAPRGYSYTGFPFFVTIQSHHIVSADQVWNP
jgi:hypothetical protein